MSADAPQKSARKHKKVKALEGADPDGGTGGAPTDKPRKSKKARTNKLDADDSQETADTRAAVSAVEGIPAPKKEKKNKKRKHTEADADVELAGRDAEKTEKKKREQVETPVSEDVEMLPVAEGTSSRKAKGKKRKTEETSEDAAAVDGDVEPAAQSESRRPKREKNRDKNKHKNREGDGAPGAEAASTSKPRKKRKRSRSALGFPDPMGDEALIEQAQKALDYAFTQFEEPDSWKFNKARQNWIIRNVWSEEAIPDTYLPLASRYLQGVQGGAREVLLKSCREAMESPQPKAEPTAVELSKPVPVESEPSKDSSTKTVKFEVLDAPSSSAAMNETKRKRAADLLAVLTSNTS